MTTKKRWKIEVSRYKITMCIGERIEFNCTHCISMAKETV